MCLPEEDAQAHSREQLIVVLAHELAHVQRRDIGWLRLVGALGAFFFFSHSSASPAASSRPSRSCSPMTSRCTAPGTAPHWSRRCSAYARRSAFDTRRRVDLRRRRVAVRAPRTPHPARHTGRSGQHPPLRLARGGAAAAHARPDRLAAAAPRPDRAHRTPDRHPQGGCAVARMRTRGGAVAHVREDSPAQSRQASITRAAMGRCTRASRRTGGPWRRRQRQ